MNRIIIMRNFALLCGLITLLSDVGNTATWQNHTISLESAKIQTKLEKILRQNIIPFWSSKIVDNNGYHLNHDQEGNGRGPSNKALVTQARTVWFFSRLYNSPYGTKEHLVLAKHGFQFLRDHMWDKEFGGFYWEVDSEGSSATKPHKHLYGQSFGLYALAEYIQASNDPDAIHLADRLFQLLEFYAHDSLHGGFNEFFLSDWTSPPEQMETYMGVTSELKLMNTHLHLMESFTSYYRVNPSPIVRQRLIELILIQSNTAFRKRIGGCTDKYQSDWTPITGAEYDRISYGHDIENIWLLIKACNATNLSHYLLLDLYQTIYNYTLQYGFEHENGGFYNTGSFSEPADQLDKVWWVQSEGLVASLHMYQLTNKKKHLTVFLQTLNWINNHQVDWENGDWHSKVNGQGEATGSKAGHWKSPYHNGRAMLECLAILSSLSKMKDTFLTD